MKSQRTAVSLQRRIRSGLPFGLLLVGYVLWRRRMTRWGTEGDEATRPLPGDDVEPDARTQSTRAITINATPEAVWPWIVQMGAERAGFYSHEWVERGIFRMRYAEPHSATRIMPEFQELHVGDRIPYGGGAYARVHQIEPPHHLVAAEAFVLDRLPDSRTRLIVRTRGNGYIIPAMGSVAPDAPRLTRMLRFMVMRVPGVRLLARAIDYFVLDPLHHYMDTGMIMGIKQRAESSSIATEAQQIPA